MIVKYLKILLLFLLVILTTIYLYYLIPLVLDGVWNYGFGYNIARGLVPYRDFNMIIPPIFPYIVSLFVLIVGNKFIIYYILISMIVVATSYIAYKRIGCFAILIYFMLLIYPHNGYNTFAVLLLFVLLRCLKNKKNDILIAIVISLMFLTKQTLGLLIIPSIIYAKDKKKTILVYIVAFLGLLLYLVINNNYYQFIDYCFLGMFDFTSKNVTKITGLTFVEIFLCLYLVIEFVKSGFRKREVIYILLFQIISFPITDGSHFVLTFSPIIYYLFCRYFNRQFRFIFSVMLIFYILGFNVGVYNSKTDVIYKDNNSFINYKRVPNYLDQYFGFIEEYTFKYKDYRLFLLDSRAYVGKLEFNMKIDKYDLINDGNMGYNGSYKYVKEIDDYCSDHKCLFIVNKEEVFNDINQTNKYIVSYIIKNYIEIAGSNIDSVYVN